MSKRTDTACALGRATVVALAAFLAAMVFIPAAAPVAKGGEAESPAKQEEAKGEAAEPAEGAEGATELTGRNATLAREAGLDEAQKKQLADVLAEAGQAMIKWQEENREAIQAANKALGDARQAADADALKQALADAQPLMQARSALQEKYNKKIRDILTPQQEVKWLGYVMYDQMTQQADAMGLTGKQLKETRALCDETAKQLAGMPAPTEASAEDSKKAMVLQQAMVRKFVDEILTEDQRKQLRQSTPVPQGGAPVESPKKPPAEESGPKGETPDAKETPVQPKG